MKHKWLQQPDYTTKIPTLHLFLSSFLLFEASCQSTTFLANSHAATSAPGEPRERRRAGLHPEFLGDLGGPGEAGVELQRIALHPKWGSDLDGLDVWVGWWNSISWCFLGWAMSNPLWCFNWGTWRMVEVVSFNSWVCIGFSMGVFNPAMRVPSLQMKGWRVGWKSNMSWNYLDLERCLISGIHFKWIANITTVCGAQWGSRGLQHECLHWRIYATSHGRRALVWRMEGRDLERRDLEGRGLEGRDLEGTGDLERAWPWSASSLCSGAEQWTLVTARTSASGGCQGIWQRQRKEGLVPWIYHLGIWEYL